MSIDSQHYSIATEMTDQSAVRDLIDMMSERFNVNATGIRAMSQTQFQRMADAFDFLRNNLPPAAESCTR